MAIQYPGTADTARAWNAAVGFPLMGFRVLPPNPYGMVVGGIENVTRPWSGVYRGPVEQGRKAIQSYGAPKTYELHESSPEVIKALLKLLGVTR